MISNVPRDALEDAIAAVHAAGNDMRFSQLVELAGKTGVFDKRRHLRFADWCGVDFSGSDLGECNFTGARLIGCDFSGALIQKSRFDQAIIDVASPNARPSSKRTNLRAAKDWDTHVEVWRRAATPCSDGHLSVGVIFQDAPFATEMVVVPAGTFMMGEGATAGAKPERNLVRTLGESAEVRPARRGWWQRRLEQIERARHVATSSVTIARPLAVGRFTVSFEEWDAAQSHPEWERCSGLMPRRPDNEKWGRGRHPVISVSWDDASAYVCWLAAVTGKPYRLLSEAEWEYVCRAGTITAYSTGNTITREQAQFGAGQTREVGSFPANAWGLHDMHGNVWEWCQDRWHDSYDDMLDDGSAWESPSKVGDLRVVRGGSWDLSSEFVRSGSRNWYTTGSQLNNLGFRVARTLTC